MANTIDTTTTTKATTVARYRDRTGATHRVIVRATDGVWEILDVATRLVDRLDGAYDDLDAAQALARVWAGEQRRGSTR